MVVNKKYLISVVLAGVLLLVSLTLWKQGNGVKSDEKLTPMAEFLKLPYLNILPRTEIVEYLYKTEEVKPRKKRIFKYMIDNYHCQKKLHDKCAKYKFHKMKKKYSVSIFLKQTEDQIEKIDLEKLSDRYNKLFYLWLPMELSRYVPSFEYTVNNPNADVILNISNIKQIGKQEIGSKYCKVDLTVDKNVLQSATFDLALPPTYSKSFTACEFETVFIFYDIVGATIIVNDNSLAENKIENFLSVEFYRWLEILNKYPNTDEEVTVIINEFVELIYDVYSADMSSHKSMQ